MATDNPLLPLLVGHLQTDQGQLGSQGGPAQLDKVGVQDLEIQIERIAIKC